MTAECLQLKGKEITRQEGLVFSSYDRYRVTPLPLKRQEGRSYARRDLELSVGTSWSWNWVL